MPLWNIVLSGYPASGKTVLARRLVSENPNFIRLNVDDLRDMYFGSTEPRDEELVYNSLATLRDLSLSSGRSVIMDTTAPNDTTREYLLNTKVKGAVRLLVLMIVDKKMLEERIEQRHVKGAIEAWDKTWQSPSSRIPLMKFRNNSREEFETSYYVLTDLLRSKVHPYKRRFLEHIYPRT
ncbi:MAG TPA: ATP-binding protein [Terriglobales bacterium]|nr:ATP-binding protein [Terriglobales bacterium]